MGLYDSLMVLADGFPEAHKSLVFQTKDLYCQLESYKVTKKGLLYRQHVVREAYRSKTSLLGFVTRDISKKWLRKTDFEGQLGMYTHDSRGTWVDYTLVFERGVLKSWKRNIAKRGKKK